MGVVLLVVWGYVCEHCGSVIHKVMMNFMWCVNLSSYVHRYFMMDLSSDELLIQCLWHLDISDSRIGFNNVLMRLRYLNNCAPYWIRLLVSDRCSIASSGMEWLSAYKAGRSDKRLGHWCHWCCVSSSSDGRLCHVVKRVIHGISASMGCHYGGGNER